MRSYERLQRQDDADARVMAYAISAPLHYTTKTPQCSDAASCPMCSNAARLAVQHYRPIIERRTVEHSVRHFDAGCQLHHGGDD